MDTTPHTKDAEVEVFLDRYAEALAGGDLPGIAACYTLPALVAGDDAAPLGRVGQRAAQLLQQRGALEQVHDKATLPRAAAAWVVAGLEVGARSRPGPLSSPPSPASRPRWAGGPG